MEPRGAARDAFDFALARLDPRRLVGKAVGQISPGAAPTALVAVGKAAARMAAGVVDPPTNGLVVTKNEHAEGVDLPASIDIRQSGHPWPDARSLAAGRELVTRVKAVPPGGSIWALVSGGASALAAVPAWGLTLADKVDATRALAAAGASIAELNTLRKHLSAIKGGRLALAARVPIRVFVISDVVGDDPSTIGGGLFAPDPTTFGQALDSARRLGVALSDPVLRVLEGGADGEHEETPKPGDPRLSHVTCEILAGPRDLAAAAAEQLGRIGYPTVAVEGDVTESVPTFAARLANRARDLAASGRACSWVGSGEPVLRIDHPRPGRGGRAQHLALACAAALARRPPPPPAADVVVLCVGSDGTDGPTRDAGGLVDAQTCARAAARGVDPDAALARFDAGTALAAAGDLVTTGPTGNNLADLFVVIARPRF